MPIPMPAIVHRLHATPCVSWAAIGAGHESAIAQPSPKIAAPAK
jgi:hypothetical protein